MEETEEAVPATTLDTAPQESRKTFRTLGILAIVAVILAAIGLGIYGLVRHPDTAGLLAVFRDVFIIVLTVVTIVIGLFLAILIFQLQSLIALLRNEIRPILDSANQTASTVRGTTSFVSDAVVTPMITAASYASAVRQTVKTLAGKDRKKKRRRKARHDAGQT